MEFPPANWDIFPVEAGPVLHSPGVYLAPAVGTSSSLYRRESGACCRDQFFTLLARIWCLLSGPILHSTGEYLVPAVGTNSSLYWRVSGACCRDQFFTLLVCIWCLLSGPVHHSTGPVLRCIGVYLVPAVGTSSSLYWRVSGAYYRDQFFTLLVKHIYKIKNLAWRHRSHGTVLPYLVWRHRSNGTVAMYFRFSILLLSILVMCYPPCGHVLPII